VARSLDGTPGDAYTAPAMSFLGRLFGGGGAPAPPPTTVVLPDDLAAALTADGTALPVAAEAALREALEARRQAADRAAAMAAQRSERVPFWLARESEEDAAIEDRLRDRLEQRRAGDDPAEKSD
jgi:hypothetical protein